MLTTAVRFIQHQLGHPARLHALLATAPALGYPLKLPLSVSTASIIRWHEWRPAGWDAKPGQLHGWGRVHDQYQGHAIQVDALATLCEQAQFDDWACDIRQVQMLSASKSPLEDFADLDAFAVATSMTRAPTTSPATWHMARSGSCSLGAATIFSSTAGMAGSASSTAAAAIIL
ncbi:hypothetical protein WH06_22765 [Aeromonas salmonicida subsp. salmonicida]|uniref:4-alpha-glucanotransferase (Amylomaltase) n=3 Tax=Aeromonas salmonicida TaxID=645 RepID=A0A1Q4MD29_AERSS|nr:hypothetical protein [Aeromonas salmonicida]ASD49309.1 4-alpha-glucanotransferase (amylomaltase) [Aeromonas salmonicida subsp. salmonicida]EHI50305.1 hypothetical protein IYQ_22425 [Aeromonas salmonicida subsp. salmonicida 01-B526]EKP0241284.1 hypothetical protein [Aeromonas salmonicida]EKP0245428.1 hypothetical protein [Aeromonas salmonicida]EKP0254142.1 hypothetical protein [Aeromonas salmonicida]